MVDKTQLSVAEGALRQRLLNWLINTTSLLAPEYNRSHRCLVWVCVAGLENNLCCGRITQTSVEFYVRQDDRIIKPTQGRFSPFLVGAGIAAVNINALPTAFKFGVKTTGAIVCSQVARDSDCRGVGRYRGLRRNQSDNHENQSNDFPQLHNPHPDPP